MGVEPYLVASAISCIAAQRLARKLCDTCAEPVERTRSRPAPPTRRDRRDARPGRSTSASRWAARTAGSTGYRGRAAIFEIMPVTEDITRLIVERAPSADIERLAVEQGMDTLRVAALRRVLSGDLSIDEMLTLWT